MALLRSRRRARTTRTVQRRRVDTARAGFTQVLAAGTTIFRPLDAWSLDIGLAAGMRLPGLTVGGLRYRMTFENSGAAVVTVVWGFGVFDKQITTPADFDPSVRQHLDWMEWGEAFIPITGVNQLFELGGGGDDGFRTTRTMRKLKEVEDDLILAVETPAAVTLRCSISTTVRLP